MDEIIDDEKKHFDAETANDDDAQPDPDEHLMLDQGNGRVWLVKMPKFLLERWTAVRAEDVHLATIRVYTPPPGTPGAKSRFVLFLPPNKNPNSSQESDASSTPPPPSSQQSNRPTFNFATSYVTTGPEPDCYELDMVNEAVENQIVVAERPKDSSLSVHGSSVPYNSRARTTILTGRIKHECNLRPSFSETYRNQLRRRHLMHNIKSRQIKRIEETGVPRGGINRLSSGVGVGAGGGGAFSDLVKTRTKPQKGFERMARIPRNQLLDQLFSHFRDTPHWGLRPLRDKTQQPEVYLKEVLSEIAFLHRSGEHNGMWELKDNFKDENIKAENVPTSNSGELLGVKMELDEDYDEDEDDDDDDMEEVS